MSFRRSKRLGAWLCRDEPQDCAASSRKKSAGKAVKHDVVHPTEMGALRGREAVEAGEHDLDRAEQPFRVLAIFRRHGIPLPSRRPEVGPAARARRFISQLSACGQESDEIYGQAAASGRRFRVAPMLKKAASFLAIAAAGIAIAAALFAGSAHAWTTDDLAALGFSGIVTNLPNGCREWSVYGHGAPVTDLGSDCDSGFQGRLDAFVTAYCSCATSSTTAMATSQDPTTSAPPTSTEEATTTSAPPPPPPPSGTVTGTTSAALPAPPFADFSAEAVNPNVVSFADASSSSSPIASRVWQFGDGAAGTGLSPVHSYPGAGSYFVTLIVVDVNGLTSLVVHELTIATNHSVALGPRQTQIVRKQLTPAPLSARNAAFIWLKARHARYPSWRYYASFTYRKTAFVDVVLLRGGLLAPRQFEIVVVSGHVKRAATVNNVSCWIDKDKVRCSSR